jgi:hypothetical protein
MNKTIKNQVLINFSQFCNPLDIKIIIIESPDMRIIYFNVLNEKYTTLNLNSMMPNELNLYKFQGVVIMPNDNSTKLVINELSKKCKFVIVQNGQRHTRKNCISVNTTLVDFNSINLHLVQLGRKPILDYNFT